MSDLERAQEWLRCRRGEFVNALTGENEAICEIHGLADDWPCTKATRLAALLAEVRAEERARIAKPGDPGARMEAYYYGFDRTGVGIIDDILSAVAHAGKAFHGTENWTEFWYGRGDFLPHGGDTPVRAIQNAADAAAEKVRRG